MTVFVAPILVYLLWRFGSKALILVFVLIGASAVYAFKVSYDNKFIGDELHL